MTLSLVDRNGLATIAAAEGEAALAAGDTPRARDKFAEAGAALEKNIAGVRRQSERHLARFLAATQFYKGGNYRKALELCKKIERRLLPAEVRPLFPEFFQDVRSRAAEGYEARVRRDLTDLWLRKDYDRILKLLQEHPYILPPSGMAEMRAVISEYLMNYRAAALFYADALRRSPNDPGLIFAAVALPRAMPKEGKLEEAWEYVRHQLELLPHPVTYLVASLVCFHRACAAATGEDQERLLKDQMRFFDQARVGYGRLPTPHQAHKEIRDLMALGFEAAASGLRRFGEYEAGRRVCDEAIAFEPTASNLWVSRGILRYPEAGSLDDFRRAIALGHDSYFPYCFLAHDAMTKGDFPSALSWSQQALRQAKKPGAPIESRLYGWIAICRSQLGA